MGSSTHDVDHDLRGSRRPGRRRAVFATASLLILTSLGRLPSGAFAPATATLTPATNATPSAAPMAGTATPSTPSAASAPTVPATSRQSLADPERLARSRIPATVGALGSRAVGAVDLSRSDTFTGDTFHLTEVTVVVDTEVPAILAGDGVRIRTTDGREHRSPAFVPVRPIEPGRSWFTFLFEVPIADAVELVLPVELDGSTHPLVLHLPGAPIPVGSDPDSPPRPSPETVPDVNGPWRDVDWTRVFVRVGEAPNVYDWADPWSMELGAVPTSVDIRGEPFSVAHRLVMNPVIGTSHALLIADIDVGIEGDPGDRIRRQLLSLANAWWFSQVRWIEQGIYDPWGWLEDPDYAHLREGGAGPGVGECGFASAFLCGSLRVDVYREACALPSGREIRCFVVAHWAYGSGAHDMWWQSTVVFDAESGVALPLDELGFDPMRLGLLLADALRHRCDHETEEARRGCYRPADPDTPVVPSDFLPTESGFVVRFDPYAVGSFADGSLEFELPWWTVERAAVATASG